MILSLNSGKRSNGMRLKNIRIIITFLSLIIVSCSYVSEQMGFHQPEVASVYPDNLMANVASNVTVEIIFSDLVTRH